MILSLLEDARVRSSTEFPPACTQQNTAAVVIGRQSTCADRDEAPAAPRKRILFIWTALDYHSSPSAAWVYDDRAEIQYPKHSPVLLLRDRMHIFNKASTTAIDVYLDHDISLDYEQKDRTSSSFSAFFYYAILNLASLFSCTVHRWVELKALYNSSFVLKSNTFYEHSLYII